MEIKDGTGRPCASCGSKRVTRRTPPESIGCVNTCEDCGFVWSPSQGTGRSPQGDHAAAIEGALRALTPPDATAALDAALAEAVARERARCADIAKNRWRYWNNDSAVSCDVTACQDISDAIANPPAIRETDQ